MLSYPIPNAALSLKGKLPSELPHGLLTPPPEVRELIEESYAPFPPGAAADEARRRQLNLETIGWYFDGLCQEVIYRPTPEGPVVLAVGSEEVSAFRTATPPEEQGNYEGYLGY